MRNMWDDDLKGGAGKKPKDHKRQNRSHQKILQKVSRIFMKFLKIDNWDRLLELDPKIIQRNICDYIS